MNIAKSADSLIHSYIEMLYRDVATMCMPWLSTVSTLLFGFQIKASAPARC